jgi:arabinogalactan endo-1,4-beta-galactosidase
MNIRKILLSIYIGSFLAIISQSTIAQNYVIGADLSFMKQAEDNGFEFKEEGEVKPCIDIFKAHGYNWIRLRLFHTPTQLPNNLEYTIALAKEAKQKGFKFLLNYHYSDTWADPGKQYIPEAWKNLSQNELVDSVYEYTKETMIAFRNAGVLPDMVQVGNEICNGMLWPNGKLPDNWDNFAQLLQSGINGVYAACGNNPLPKIMIHIAKGGSKNYTKYYFDKIKSYGIEYDVIGQSYYPWWHGSLLDLRDCLFFAAKEYKKDLIVVEAAYNFAPKEYVDKLPPFPESPQGQKEFLEEVNRIVLSVPENRGLGIFWWEPAAPGRGFSTRTFFDNDGNVMPVITVFDKYTRK